MIRRLTALLLLPALVLTLSGLHVCEGEECAFCSAVGELRVLAALAFLTATRLFFHMLFHAGAEKSSAFAFLRVETPVSRRVKLSD